MGSKWGTFLRNPSRRLKRIGFTAPLHYFVTKILRGVCNLLDFLINTMQKGEAAWLECRLQKGPT